MTNPLYANLADLFNRIGFGSGQSPELYALLESLFNQEEARVALALSPFSPEPPAQVAQRLGMDPVHIAALLDKMADKGLIYASQRGQDKRYKTIQLVPGIFELQFMKGEVTERAKELARLFDAYFHAPRPEPAPGEAAAPPRVSFARVIPIQKTVSSEIEIFPYEEAARYIDAADTITVSTCYCRHEQRLLDHGCGFPDDVCLQLGPFARFVRDRGFGREISREEAHKVMRRSAEAGLIATSSNTSDRIDFICNCCTCCCAILRNVKERGGYVRGVASNYAAEVDEASCIGCGECVERCQMEAITLTDDEIAEIDTARCVGCGVCVVTCGSEAMSLKSREDVVQPPRSFQELIERQAAEKQRSGRG
jgi:Pyruvate/2-oxoacid:ferredoxin oxidoreductase delta subunit/DNA-binding MarR family transcriptional regulator